MKKLIIAALTAVALAFTVPQIVRSDGFNTVSDLTSVSSDICVANASGGCLQNEAASTTNPTLIPDQGELTTGIGGIGSSTVSIIVNGVEQGTFNNQGITGSVGGARLRAQAPSATAPNILPSGASDPNTGIGWDGADRLSLIAGGVEGLLVSTTGVTIDTSTIDTLVIATRSTITATGIVDLSSSDASTTTEGFILPQHATACAGGTAEGQVCWEADANILHIGDGTTIQDFPPASAFSGDATVTGTGVVTISADAITSALMADSAFQAGKNLLINGEFTIAQRGTSFTSATTPDNTDDNYLLDRWVFLSASSDAADITQESSTVPTGSFNAIRLDVEANTDSLWGIIQFVEARNAERVIGGTVSLSFKARRTGASIDHLRAAILAWDGTEDSVTSDVVSVWEPAGTDPTLVANWTYENTPANLATLTTSFQTFTIENISIDTAGAENVAVFIWIDDNTTTAGDFLYITDVQLEQGAVATTYGRRLIGQELALSQRYYTKTFPQGTAPADNAGNAGSFMGSAVVTGDDEPMANWRFLVVMRVAPTVTRYNPGSGTAGEWGNAASVGSSARTVNITDSSVIIDNTGTTLAAATQWHISLQADSEL